MDLMDPEVERLAHEAWRGYAEKYAELEQRQLEQMNASLRGFLEDLLNYPLQRPWRESLDLFQEHYWQQAGLRLTSDSYQKVAALIERLVNDPRCHACGPIQTGAVASRTGQPTGDVAAREESAQPVGIPPNQVKNLHSPVPRVAAGGENRTALTRDSQKNAAPSVPRFRTRYAYGINAEQRPLFAARPIGQTVQPSPGELFFNAKVAEADGCLDEMRQILEALGNKLDAAQLDETIDVDDEVDAVEELIWRYNDLLESALDIWLRDGLSGDLLNRLFQMRTPGAFRLPRFTDDEQAGRALRQGLLISQRLGRRDTAMDRFIAGMKAVEIAGTAASLLLAGGLVITAARTGGKWAVVKTLAVAGAVGLGEHAAERGLRAAGAGEQVIRGFRLAALVVSFILLRRRNSSADTGTQPPALQKPVASPPVRPKGRLLPPEEARRKVGVAFNKAREGAYPHTDVPIVKPSGGKPYMLDSYDPIKGEIVFRRHTQFSEIQFKTAQVYFREFVKKYPPGSVIANVPSAKGLAGQKLEGKMIFEVPPQWKAIPKAVLREAARYEIIIRDSNGRVYHAD